MSELRPPQVGDRVKIQQLDKLEHFIGEIGIILQITPYEDGIFIDVAIYDGRVRFRVYEPPPKLIIIYRSQADS
jgi:hypothetical protein